MEKIVDKVDQVFGIYSTIFTGPVSDEVKVVSIDDLLRMTDQFLERRGEPAVVLAFTRAGVYNEDILGQGSSLHRGAWIRWNDKIQQITITTLHELGHICEANHCIDESCIMFPTYREHRGDSLSTLFCDNCRTTIQNSWVYCRLTQSAEDRAKKQQRLQRIVESPPLQLPSSKQQLGQPVPIRDLSSCSSTPPFPDGTLVGRDREEFLRKAMEHFGLRRRGS
jgi:hypothetical protein